MQFSIGNLFRVTAMAAGLFAMSNSPLGLPLSVALLGFLLLSVVMCGIPMIVLSAPADGQQLSPAKHPLLPIFCKLLIIGVAMLISAPLLAVVCAG